MLVCIFKATFIHIDPSVSFIHSFLSGIISFGLRNFHVQFTSEESHDELSHADYLGLLFILNLRNN